jgi:Mrr N-terminal domain
VSIGGDQVTAALDLAAEEVELAIAEVKTAAKRAIDADRLAEARRLTDQIAPMRSFKSRITDARREWLKGRSNGRRTSTPGGRTQRRRNLGRLEPGKATPNSAFFAPLLAIVEECGGNVSARVALEKLADRMASTFTSYDYESLPSARGHNEVRWRKAAQWARRDLVVRGLLASDSPRGFWSITEEGRHWLTERRSSELDLKS